MVRKYLIHYKINDMKPLKREQQATNQEQAILLLTTAIDIAYMFKGKGRPKIVVKKIEEVL